MGVSLLAVLLPSEVTMNRKMIQKILLIMTGSVSLALGVIGIIIPVLPTTPFLLIACFCYLRSSKKLYDWLLHHRVFGTYLNNYMKYKAVTKRAKIIAIVSLWTSLSISMLLVANLHVRILLLAVGIGVTVHLLTLKTIPLNGVIRQQYDGNEEKLDFDDDNERRDESCEER